MVLFQFLFSIFFIFLISFLCASFTLSLCVSRLLFYILSIFLQVLSPSSKLSIGKSLTQYLQNLSINIEDIIFLNVFPKNSYQTLPRKTEQQTNNTKNRTEDLNTDKFKEQIIIHIKTT